MAQIVLHPTDIASWHALINEAEQHCQIQLHQDLESYLVFLLKRFTTRADFASSILATEFLQGVQCSGSEKQNKLRDVGDKCLLFSGLFPGRAKAINVKVSYFVDMGQTAYDVLSYSDKIGFNKLFTELSQYFVKLMDILHAIRYVAGEKKLLQPIEAIDLWYEKQSQQAHELLKTYASDALALSLKHKTKKDN